MRLFFSLTQFENKMSKTIIKNTLDQLAKDWHSFQDVNNRRLDEIETKGSADPLTIEALNKLNSKLSCLEVSLKRPQIETKSSSGFSSNELEHKNAFTSYLRKGYEQSLQSFEKKSLSSQSEKDGGYLVSRPMSQHIAQEMISNSVMRKLANVTNISSDAMELIIDQESAMSGWTLETDERRETLSPSIGKKIIPVHELYAQPKATQKLLDDSAIDVENWLAEKLVNTFANMENDAFINGDGQGKPRGILSYSKKEIEQIDSSSNGTISPESLILLFYALDGKYSANAKFLMNRESIQLIRTLRDPSNQHYIWQPSLKEGTPNTLLGLEVIECANMPKVETGNIAIALADFKSAYQIVDRQGVKTLRDPFTEKPFVKFYTTKRVGGDVINTKAIKLLKLN